MTETSERAPFVEGNVIKLLVVDDHQTMREGLIGLLNHQEDLEVVGQAADGSDAVKKAEILRPDAVIMDVDMPVMNGIEATWHIKQRHKTTVVVALSLHEEPSTRRAMAEAGSDAYLSKSASGKTLVRAIRQACSRPVRAALKAQRV